jgi:MFS family permease
MKRGFYTIMAAQFFSSLADNALLIAAIAMLVELTAPAWTTPLLKLFFTISYVLLAPFVGALADSMLKGRVMLIANFVKVVGCALMFFAVNPLLAYAIVGFGAAAYSPAKYGILTELLPAEKLVVANGWLEGTTIASIVLGTVLGGALISPTVSPWLLSIGVPGIDTTAKAAMLVIAMVYMLAGAFNLGIPDTGARYPRQLRHPIKLVVAFAHANSVLWRDKLGQISLTVTTLLWGAGATLQFIVLDWARESLGLPLNQAAVLQGVVAIGIAGGAVLAASIVSLKLALRVLPFGIMLGAVLPIMTLVQSIPVAYGLLVLVGALAGYFVVPMNAMLQHRGYVRLSAGHSIAVQNFNENLNILVMLGLYALLIAYDFPVNSAIIMLGLMISGITALVMLWHKHNQRKYNSESLIGEERKERRFRKKG